MVSPFYLLLFACANLLLVAISKIIKSAKQSILVFDNYIDETVLVQLSKREKGVGVVIFTQKILQNS